MVYNVLKYLEDAARKNGSKAAFRDINKQLTFSELRNSARSIATFLLYQKIECCPVAIMMEKSVDSISTFLGCLYSRNFYVPIDTKMPAQRIRLILDRVKAGIIIADEKNESTARELAMQEKIVLFHDAESTRQDDEQLMRAAGHFLDTDPAYILFTSGSTGMPKGVTICQRSLIDYVERLCEELKFSEEDVFGNQSPFFFDPSVIDIYCTIKCSASMCIIPTSYFSFPLKLLDYLESNQITTIRWVPSALSIISHCDGLSKKRPSKLAKIIFGSEVMPVGCYHYWKQWYPDCKFIQVYGPTEITGTCTYYWIEKEFDETEQIPIGNSYYNTGVFLLDEEDQLVCESGKQGEICVKGSCLSLGYYNDPERTDQAFVQNPLNHSFRELIYRTGDLGKYNDEKELIFISRKDYQIKHMGYRIELGEIEAVANQLSSLKGCCCVFDADQDKIAIFYEAEAVTRDEVSAWLKDRLPRYMLPNEYIELPEMPLTASGKMDRKKLHDMFCRERTAK